MLNRITYGAVAIIAVFTLIVLDALISRTSAQTPLAELGRKGSLIPLFFTILAFGAAVELARLMRSVGLRPQVRWAVFWAVVLMLAPWLVSGVLLPRYPSDLSGTQWLLAAVVLALSSTVLPVLSRRNLTGALADVGATWAIIVYAGFLPSFAVQLRCHPFLDGPDGAWLIVILLSVVKVSDIGAFFIGSAFGTHKLIPWVSPKKSVEGAMGGVLCAVTVSLFFWFAFEWIHPGITAAAVESAGGEDPSKAVPLLYTMTQLFHELSLSQAIIFGVLMSISGQLGDLLESVFKRAAGAKDSAHLLPGFGGVLDIIDSPVLAAPIAWFLLTCLWAVV